jgi:hypothetical protein
MVEIIEWFDMILDGSKIEIISNGDSWSMVAKNDLNKTSFESKNRFENQLWSNPKLEINCFK